MIRRLATALAILGLVSALAAPASAAGLTGGGTGIRSVTAITDVFTFGQKVAAVAVEYSQVVSPRTLGPHTYTVSDTSYNFRFNPIEDLAKRAERTITRVYTNDHVALTANGRATPGRFVIVELAPTDPGGNTVIQSACSTPLCFVKVNPNLPTEIVQNRDVYARPGKGVGRGELVAAGSPTAHGLNGKTVNLYVDRFRLDTYSRAGAVLPYAYYLPPNYDPRRTYPMVVILPGYGMGWNGENLGVQIAADIPATAWLRPEWKGTSEDVIVLAPQNQRVGVPDEADIMVSLVERFMRTHRVDAHRVYASTVSYGSTTLWQAMATHPGLFSAALVTGGFQVSTDQAARIATARTPMWITHGLHDPVLPVAFGRESAATLRSAYVAAGADPTDAETLIRYTEFGDEAYSEPDYHAVMGPTYQNTAILRWLLAQRH